MEDQLDQPAVNGGLIDETTLQIQGFNSIEGFGGLVPPVAETPEMLTVPEAVEPLAEAVTQADEVIQPESV